MECGLVTLLIGPLSATAAGVSCSLLSVSVLESFSSEVGCCCSTVEVAAMIGRRVKVGERQGGRSRILSDEAIKSSLGKCDCDVGVGVGLGPVLLSIGFDGKLTRLARRVTRRVRRIHHEYE